MSFSSDLLAGQVGIVTGAGSPLGIGRSMVIALAAAGAKAVYACDLNLANIPSLQEAVKTAGYATHVDGKLLDVADELQTVELLKEITRKHGRFDFFFANAGYAKYRNLDDLSSQSFDRAIAVMTRSVYLAIRYGSKAMMVTSPEKLRPMGSVVITNSCSAYLGSYADLAYTTAKSALLGMVASASVQLSHSNIRVNAVAPGFTSSSILACADQVEKGGEFTLSQTAEEVEVVKKQHAKFFKEAGLLANTQYYYNRTQEAEEIANVAVFLASHLAKAVNGQTLLADSGKTEAAMGEGCTGPIPLIQPLEL